MTTPAYSVRSLAKSYRGGATRANDGIDLDVVAGEVFGLLGPNGAGKSTLVRQLCALVRPDAGSIALFGHDLLLRPRLAAQTVAYLAQDETALADVSVRLAVTATARLRGLPPAAADRAANDLIDEFALGAVATRPLVKLSGGERRLACVASALAADRPVLILDEPTAGLDPVARRAVWAALARRRVEHGTTVVLVTHNVLEAETVLDRVAVLDRGKVIACDTPGRLKAAYGNDVRLDLVWRAEPPSSDPTVVRLAERAVVDGRRWQVRMPQDEARAALGALSSGAAFAALDDFTLATATLEDVYVRLGGRDDDLERA